MSRLLKRYREEIVPEMMKRFGYKNQWQVTRLEKIVINMGRGGEAMSDQKILDTAMKELATITGQTPVITRGKKSISNFKLRKGMPIGCKVTLRKKIMYEFFDRLVNVVLPRIRDFQGLNDFSFDQSGNFSLGIQEQIVFPEINYDKVTKIGGMDITIVTTSGKKEEVKELLVLLGMPFRKSES